MENHEPKLYYSVQEIINVTRLSRNLIRRLVMEGKLPSLKIGTRRLIKAHVYHHFLEHGLVGIEELK